MSENVQRDSDEEHPSEIAGSAKDEADAGEEDAGYDVKCAADVAGFGEGEVVYDLQEGGEVGVPAIVRNLVSELEEAGADDGAIGEEVSGNEGDLGQENLYIAKRIRGMRPVVCIAML